MSFDLNELLNCDKVIPYYEERKNKSEAKNLGPIAVEFHWTSNCNYDCFHCSYGSRRETKGYLNKEIIEGLIDDLVHLNCRAVYLSGGGEPTVLSKWDRYANKLIDNGVEVALITNQAAIKEKYYGVVRRMNYVAVSVYSTDIDRYEKITGSKYFDDQFSLPNKIKKDLTNVVVGARCVLNSVNYDEVFDIYAAAISSGFDYIVFIPVVDYEGTGIALGQEMLDRIGRDVESRMSDFDPNRTNVSSLLDRKISHYARNDYRNDIVNQINGCKAVQIRTGAFVNYDGGIYLCQPDIGNTEYEIGNLHDNTFLEIWNSSRHLEILDGLNERYDRGKCSNCRSICFNKSMYKAELDGGLIDVKRDPFV